MKLTTVAKTIFAALTLTLCFTLGFTVSYCTENERLMNLIVKLKLQHGGEIYIYAQDLSECNSTTETYKQWYSFLAGVVAGEPLSEELTEDVARMASQIDGLHNFTQKMEKGLRTNRRR